MKSYSVPTWVLTGMSSVTVTLIRLPAMASPAASPDHVPAAIARSTLARSISLSDPFTFSRLPSTTPCAVRS